MVRHCAPHGFARDLLGFAPGVRHVRHPCAGYAMRGGCARARGGGYVMRQLCARARIRARIVARVCRAGTVGMARACQWFTVGMPCAAHCGGFCGAWRRIARERVARGMAGHFGRLARHFGAWRGVANDSGRGR